MSRSIRRVYLIGSTVLMAVILSACNLSGSTAQAPQIMIQSPQSGFAVAVNEPIIISAVATDLDGNGVARVEVFVDGESINEIAPPTGSPDVFDIATTLTFDTEGQFVVILIAYRRDGTPSAPATLILNVVGMTRDPDLPIQPTLTDQPTPTAADRPILTQASGVQAEVITLSNIRSGPGPFCDIIGFAEDGDTILLLEFSKDSQWLLTDFNGWVGWIYNESLIIEDEDQILVGDATGCQGCGDGVCNPSETCDSCSADCGQCCGNGVCEADFGEDCGTCASDCGACCGNGTCEAERGEDCGTCESDCGGCCGNGSCEADRGETCSTCGADCGSCCGNGLCEDSEGEDCGSCPGDCGQCCGDGLCESGRGETCSSCTGDCGVCTPVPSVCGDTVCDSDEDCASCEDDCGVCP